MKPVLTGRLNTSQTVHLVNEHGLTACGGYKVDVLYRKPSKRRACRNCFGSGVNVAATRRSVVG